MGERTWRGAVSSDVAMLLLLPLAGVTGRPTVAMSEEDIRDTIVAWEMSSTDRAGKKRGQRLARNRTRHGATSEGSARPRVVECDSRFFPPTRSIISTLLSATGTGVLAPEALLACRRATAPAWASIGASSVAASWDALTVSYCMYLINL